METLFKRRSIRRYTDEPVAPEQIRRILEAAMVAPSAGDQRPWEFVVIDDRKTLDTVPSIHPHSNMIREASVAILVCGDPSREKHKGYWAQDCSAAVMNILLEAVELDLGAVWLGVYPREDRVEGLRKLLGIPEGIIPFALVPVGHVREPKPPAERFEETRIHRNKW